MTIINPPNWLEEGTYTAKMDRMVLSGIIATPGITKETSFKIVQNSPLAMSVRAQPGTAYVQGTDLTGQGTYHVINDSDLVATIPTSNALNPRSDLVYLRVYDSEISGGQSVAVVEVLAGVPSSSPVTPSLPPSSIPLATVLVGAGVTFISASNIVDVRPTSKFHNTLLRNLVQQPEPWQYFLTAGVYGPQWTDYPNTTYSMPAFRRFNGKVQFKGLANGPSSGMLNNTGQVLATMPVGYRSSLIQILKGHAVGEFNRTGTQSSGSVHQHIYGIQNIPLRTWIHPDGRMELRMGHSDAPFWAEQTASTPWFNLTGMEYDIA